MSFKIGDKVKINNSCEFDNIKYRDFGVGIVVEVSNSINLKARYKVNFDGNILYCSEEFLVLIDEKTYEDGLKEAWDYARKISKLSYEERNDILGTNNTNNSITYIIETMQIDDVIKKFKEYETNVTFSVGDIVVEKNARRIGIVTDPMNGLSKIEVNWNVAVKDNKAITILRKKDIEKTHYTVESIHSLIRDLITVNEK